MCKESGANRASLTDLKKGRKQGLSAETLAKIATYFKVSVDFLLGVETKKAPTDGERTVSDDDIKFALFGGDGEITDAMQLQIADEIADENPPPFLRAGMFYRALIFRMTPLYTLGFATCSVSIRSSMIWKTSS